MIDFKQPEAVVHVEQRVLMSRYPNQARMYPGPVVCRWVKPPGAKVAFLINMEEMPSEKHQPS